MKLNRNSSTFINYKLSEWKITREYIFIGGLLKYFRRVNIAFQTFLSGLIVRFRVRSQMEYLLVRPERCFLSAQLFYNAPQRSSSTLHMFVTGEARTWLNHYWKFVQLFMKSFSQIAWCYESLDKRIILKMKSRYEQ